MLKKTYMSLEGVFVAKGLTAQGTLHTRCLAKALHSLLRLPLTFPFTFYLLGTVPGTVTTGTDMFISIFVQKAGL